MLPFLALMLALLPDSSRLRTCRAAPDADGRFRPPIASARVSRRAKRRGSREKILPA